MIGVLEASDWPLVCFIAVELGVLVWALWCIHRIWR